MPRINPSCTARARGAENRVIYNLFFASGMDLTYSSTFLDDVITAGQAED